MRKTFTLLFLLSLFNVALAQNDAALSPPTGNITAPVSGCSLTSTENVTIRIFNFGPGTINTPFNVSYSINGGPAVTELVAAPNIPANTSFTYTFVTQADLSTPGTYTFDATVSLAGDPTPSNDTYTGYVVNSLAPSAGGTIAGPSSVCISGNSGTLTLSGNTGNVLRWETSTDGGGTWVNITNTTTTQNYNNLTVPTMYRAVVQNGTCAAANSTPISINIDPATVGGTVSGSATVCSGSNSGNLTLTGRTGTIQNWEFSTDNGTTWTPIANTASTQSYLNLTATTWYRAVVKSGACNPANSSIGIITVSPVTVGGSVTPASTTVCSGSNSGTLTLSGHTGTVQRWEFSTDGGVTWTNIANTTTSQNYTNLTATRLYRAVVKSGACSTANSAAATITVSPGTTAGTLSANATVCSGSNSGTLNVAGNVGSVVRWEFSTDGGVTWTNIANTTTSETYTNLTTTTLYRVLVQNGTCTSAYTNNVTITVNPVSVGGTTASNATVCSGSNGGTITLTGQTGSITGWESSTDGGVTWSPIANTTTSQAYSNLTASTIYHAVIQSGVCPSTTSSNATITVDPVTVGGSISGSATVCSGSNSGTLTLSGNTGSVLSWEFSTDNGLTWISISNTTTSQTYTNLTTPTMYRALVKSGVCNPVYSGTATIGIDPVSNGGTIYGTATVCSGSNSGTLSLIGQAGTITGWESSNDNGVTWVPTGNTSTFENYNNLTDTTFYRVIVRSGVCPADTSAPATIYVDQNSIGGTVSTSDTVCSGSNSGTLTLSGQTGNVMGWEISTDGGFTWISVSNTTTSQTYNNLTTTTMYRALVKNGVCNPVNSTAATITVDPASNGGMVMGSATVCASGNSGMLTLNGYVGNIVDWESSNDNGVTWTPVGSTNDTIAYTNLTDTTWYRAIVINGSVCSSDTSTIGTITVDPATNAGMVTGGDTVCAGANAGVLTLTGYTGNILGWEYSNNGVTWFPINNTSATQSYANLTATTIYHALVKSGVCNSAYSAPDTIKVNPVSNGGTITGSATVCASSNSGLLTLTGYTGAVQSWEWSNDGITWTPVANTTDTLSYTNLTDTTYYRAIVMSGVCAADTSAPATIIVDPVVMGGTIAGSDTVCTGINSDTLALTGYTGTIIGWEFSTDGGNTWLLSTNTNDTLITNNLTGSRWYRVRVQSGVCGIAYSDTAFIKVDPISVGGTITGSATVCATANNGLLTLTGYTGTVQSWEWSNDGITWTPVANTTDTLSYTNLTDTTYYHAIVMSGACSADTSAMATIVVDPVAMGGTIAGSDTVCTGINSDTLVLTGYTGTIIGWEFSTDGGNTWLMSTNTNDSLIANNLSASRWYRVRVQSGVCGVAYSDTAFIQVDPISVGGTVNGSTAACEGASGTLTLTGYTGTVQMWESSTDGGLTWTSIANTTATQTYSSLTDTTWFRAIVMSGVCSSDTSSAAVITIWPKPVASFTAASTCFGNTTAFTNTTTIASGTIMFNMWDFGDGNVSINPNPNYTYSDTGTYVVTLIVTSDMNCKDTATVNVTVNPLPLAQIVSSLPLQFCEGDSTTLTAPAGTNYAYLWSTGDTLQAITVDTSGTFVVTVTDTVTGCMKVDSVSITVNPLPTANAGTDTTISLGSSVMLNGSGGISFTWTPSASLNDPNIASPLATPQATTDYILTVTDANGCSDMDTVTVTVEPNFDFMIANMITPNGDGFNDTWYVQNIELYPNNEVSVFNRNGQRVFNATSYDNTWTGDDLPDGTYYYVIKFTDTDKIIKGSVTILRSKK